MIVESKTRYTPADLLSMPDREFYELVDGQLVELNVSALASIVAARTNHKVSSFLDSNPLGDVLASDCTYQCFPDDPDKVRRPDGSFIRKGRLPRDQLLQGHVRIAPDWALEVVSPNDSAYEVDQKVEEYLRAGVSLVWVINPETRIVHVHRRDGTVTKLHENDELAGENVLPGFHCKVSELFPAAEVSAA